MTEFKTPAKKIGAYDDCVNQFVFSEINSHTTCLDVGCWTGNLGSNLIKKKHCIVDGLDYRDDVLMEAKKKRYRKTFCVNLNDPNANLAALAGNKYDTIIFSDVLEHTSDPERILNYFEEFLKEDGMIIISIPNALFFSRRLSFLIGDFNYTDGGIMDRTHLRFFTGKSIKKMCQAAGYEIEKFYGYAQVKNKFFFLRFLSSILPNLFAVQFIARIRKA